MVKITDVAIRAGVAKSTVSNVLTGRKYVSEELRQKVLDACREMDFYPNFYASSLSKRKTNILALVMGDENNITEYPFYGDLLVSCVAEASSHGYSLLTYYEQDTENLLNVLRRGCAPIDGALVMSPCVDDERFTQLENDRVHCVSIGRPDRTGGISYVDVDNERFVYDVVKTLSQTYGGPIFLANAPKKMTISADRERGYYKACQELGRSTEHGTDHYRERSETDGYNFAKDRVQPDALFIAADAIMCRGIYRAIEEAGLRVGKDVGVFALGKSVTEERLTPKLSYGHQDYSQIGRLAIQMLVGEIESGTARGVVYADNKLHFHESTQK